MVVLPSWTLIRLTNPCSFPSKSTLGNLGPLFLPYFVGMSASPAAAATAAVVTKPEEAFSSCSPAAGAAGMWPWKGPLVLHGTQVALELAGIKVQPLPASRFQERRIRQLSPPPRDVKRSAL